MAKTRHKLQKHNILIFCLCLFFFPLFSSNDVYSEETVEVKAVRHWVSNETIRVVIDLTSTVEFTKGRLSNPERLFLDLKNSRLQKGIPSNYGVGNALLKMVRLGQFNANTVRVVFDLERAEFDYKVFVLEDPARLVVDFIMKSTTVPERPDKKEKEKELERPVDNTKIEAAQIKKKIVLDPGHGGHDPGAVGPTGLYEKDVVLDVALKTKEHLNKRYPHYEVFLTRDRDVFIPLDKRAQIANDLKADLFVSIHTNASTNRLARGIETYLLNWTDDEEAMKVAARENAISFKQMKELRNEVSIILTSLERESKRDESIKVAGYVQNALSASITADYPLVADLGVKQALFYVLVGAKMPSVLTELGFISNPQEEKLLATEDFRDRLAHSLAEGINAYFLNLPAEKIARYSKPILPDRKVATAEPVKYEKKTVSAEKKRSNTKTNTNKPANNKSSKKATARRI